jgi:hypothetical protein
VFTARQMQHENTLLASGCSSARSTPTEHAHPACAGFTQTRKRRRHSGPAAMLDSRLHCAGFRVAMRMLLLLGCCTPTLISRFCFHKRSLVMILGVLPAVASAMLHWSTGASH